MTSSCRSCHQGFTIGDDDLAFYEKISSEFNGKKELIPPPTLCPQCRMVSRYVWRNEFSRYERPCDMTGKKIICPYSIDKRFKVYSQDAWWSDNWSALDYGRPYDFNRSFFDQMAELLPLVPVMATYRLYCENSEYSDWCSYLKNCYLLSSSSNATEDSYYGRLVNHSRNCVDCFSVRDCELCYDCVECEKCYNVAYSQNSYRCVDSSFLINCLGCKNCFACVNLRQGEYVWMNEQLTKEEYFSRLQKWQSGSWSNVQKGKQWIAEYRKKFPVRFYNGENNEDSTGNFINNCKNAQYCFDCFDLEDSKYCSQMFMSKDCHDMLTWGRPGELLYYCHGTGDHAYRNAFCTMCANSKEIMYCVQCMNNENLFGCVGLKKAKYCILNKQYTKEEYEILVPKIIEQMRKSSVFAPDGRESIPDQVEDRLSFSKGGVFNDASSLQESLNNGTQDGSMTSPFVKGSTPTLSSSEGEGGGISEWGEFFPPSLSPFGYNETIAADYAPITREEAVQKGFNWSDYVPPKPQVEKTVKASQLPDSITDIPDTILDWAIECEVSGRPFRIIKQELRFLREHGIPLPHRHPDIRYRDRLAMRNPRLLFSRTCGNCAKNIETSYPPDRPEKVLCSECYLGEVY